MERSDYSVLLEDLFSHADEAYQAFHGKLLKNDGIKLIGVRTPVLRKMAKKWKGRYGELKRFPNEYYEVVFLKCAVASFLPFESLCEEIESLVELLDNWATCDCFKPKCIAKRKEEFLPYIKQFLRDKREFSQRFSLVSLLNFYVEEKYLPQILQSVQECDGAYYYVYMAAAWLVAEVLVKYYEVGLGWMKEGKIPTSIQNKAIQKARESFRLTQAQKDSLKSCRK